MLRLNERPVAPATAADAALERLQIAFAASGLGLWRWSAERGMRCSDRTLEIAGLGREALEADPDALRRLVHPEDVEALWRLDEAMLDGKAYDGEYRLWLPGGRVRWVAHHARPELDDDGNPVGLIGSLADITEHKLIEQRLLSARDQLEAHVRERTDLLAHANAALENEVTERRTAEAHVRELLGQLVNAEEEERRRLARELHDSLGQHLTALSLGLKALEAEPALGPAARKRLATLQVVTRRMDDDVDRLAHQLRPTALDDLGLDDALRELATTWQHDSGLEVECHLRGLRGRRFPRALETTVYRVVQEALNNVRKHAKATRVGLIVEDRDGQLRVIVEDDGRGFEPGLDPRADTGAGRRMGLRGMTERAALAGGRFEIESAPGQGTTLYLTLPASVEDEPT